MKHFSSPLLRRADAPYVTISFAALTGLRPIGGEREEAVRISQMRAADSMIAVRATIALVSICFVDLLCLTHVPNWQLILWTLAAIGARVPLTRLRRRNERQNYAGVSRGTILYQGAVSTACGLLWLLPMLVFARSADPVEMVALWTLTSCLMTVVAIALHPTPLAAIGFLFPVGAASILMMTRQGDPLLITVVATYTLLLLITSLRQTHQFAEQLRTSRQLAEKQEVVSLLLKEHHHEGGDWLWQTDAYGSLKGVSPAFSDMLGSHSELLEGRPILTAFVSADYEPGKRNAALEGLAEKIASRTAFTDLIVPIRVHGEQRWWELSASPRVDEQGNFLGFRGVGSDVTARKESAERIAQLARHDMLTNLPNRLSITEELTAAIDNMERWGRPCAFMMIDLDRYKAVNDSLGHQVGDELLVQVADRLRRICVPDIVIGRLGGDEFGVVLRDVADPGVIARIAGTIIDAVSEPYAVDRHILNIGASIGSATAPRNGRTAHSLIQGADLAMYRAKEAGGGRHFAFEPVMLADIEERRMLEAALRDALVNNQLHLVYQPIIDARSGDITSFEALVRWTHPTLGEVPPARFIPIAEDARLIGPIGDWVLRKACVEAAGWPVPARISVNISPEQLRDPEFLETIVSVLAHSGLPASRLALELTESVFLRERPGAVPLLDKLSRLGVGLVLDDFGTGHSSIGYLSRTPFCEIKIERAFISGAALGYRESLAIVRAIVAMAESLGIDSVAEGVESEAEYQRILHLGFSKMQGFHFGRPMLAGDARALLGRRSSDVA